MTKTFSNSTPILSTPRICEGGRDNLPDRNSVENTKAIVEQVQASDNSHLVIVLISGGGSALLCHPAEGISLEDLIYLTKTVAGAGATIQELNKCRIVLSQVKGGKLAKMAFPAQVVDMYMLSVFYYILIPFILCMSCAVVRIYDQT